MDLSRTMKHALFLAKSIGGGALVRAPGGFWFPQSEPRYHEWAGTKTVEALVTRGLGRYEDWIEGRARRFPTRFVVQEPTDAK